MIQSKVLENLEIKNLNHLGIIAGIIDEIGMVEIINKQLGEDRSEIVSPGVIVKSCGSVAIP